MEIKLPSPKADPKSLGIVQTMIGIVIFMFGFAAKYFDPLVIVYSGSMFWGSLCFLISGALSIAIVDHNHPNLVKSALGLNLLSAVAAFVAAIMFCVDLVHVTPSHDTTITPFTFFLLSSFRILMVLLILEVCVSIWTLVLIWKARGSTEVTEST